MRWLVWSWKRAGKKSRAQAQNAFRRRSLNNVKQSQGEKKSSGKGTAQKSEQCWGQICPFPNVNNSSNIRLCWWCFYEMEILPFRTLVINLLCQSSRFFLFSEKLRDAMSDENKIEWNFQPSWPDKSQYFLLSSPPSSLKWVQVDDVIAVKFVVWFVFQLHGELIRNGQKRFTTRWHSCQHPNSLCCPRCQFRVHDNETCRLKLRMLSITSLPTLEPMIRSLDVKSNRKLVFVRVSALAPSFNPPTI